MNGTLQIPGCTCQRFNHIQLLRTPLLLALKRRGTAIAGNALQTEKAIPGFWPHLYSGLWSKDAARGSALFIP